MPKMYGWVREVVPESLADQIGLVPGDLIQAINEKPIRDLIDYRYAITDEQLVLSVKRQEQELTLNVDERDRRGSWCALWRGAGAIHSPVRQ